MRRHVIRLILSILVVLVPLGVVVASDTSPQLGLDLQGGISVVLAPTKEAKTDALSKAVEIIRNRVDALGVAEPDVSLQGDNIVVDLPGVEDQDKARDLVGTTAELRFRPVLQVFPPGSSGTTTTTAPGATTTTGPGGATTTTAPGAPTTVTTTQRGTVTAGQAATTTTVPATTPTTAPPAAPPEAPPGACVPRKSAVDDPTAIVVLPFRETDEERKGTLECLGPAEMTGEAVKSAKARFESGWGVTAKFTEKGAEQFNALAAKYFQRQVAIVLDGVVESAAGMRSPAEAGGAGSGVECGTGITGGDTQIDVGDQPEAKDLALVLRTGALPLTLEQSEVSKVSPTLGRDSLNAGLTAGILGLALVMAYMVLYYRALGLVVWVGLAVFTAILYTIMALLGESAGLSLSLAGVAGFIVSVGVTADSYIVAFERLKDESHSGKTLRAAVAQGMTRSFRTILVADFVTAAAAIILFLLAVGPVRGFALTLGLATLVDVLIAYYFTRPAVTLLARSRLFSEGRFIGMRAALGVQPS